MTTKGWLAQTGGVLLIAVGFASCLLGLFFKLEVLGGRPIALVLFGGQMMIVGTILWCYQQLLIRSTRNEEALLFQYDIGYEKGWQERERSGSPVVVDISSRMPCPCGSGKAQKTAVKVGDRG